VRARRQKYNLEGNMTQKNLVQISIEPQEGPDDYFHVRGPDQHPFLVSKDVAENACKAKRLARAIGSAHVDIDFGSSKTHEVAFGTRKGGRMAVHLSRHSLGTNFPDIIVVRPNETVKSHTRSELQPGAA